MDQYPHTAWRGDFWIWGRCFCLCSFSLCDLYQMKFLSSHGLILSALNSHGYGRETRDIRGNGSIFCLFDAAMVTENTSVQQECNFHSSSWIHSSPHPSPLTYGGADGRWIEVLYSLQGTLPLFPILCSLGGDMLEMAVPQNVRVLDPEFAERRLSLNMITLWVGRSNFYISGRFNSKTRPVLETVDSLP